MGGTKFYPVCWILTLEHSSPHRGTERDAFPRVNFPDSKEFLHHFIQRNYFYIYDRVAFLSFNIDYRQESCWFFDRGGNFWLSFKDWAHSSKDRFTFGVIHILRSQILTPCRPFFWSQSCKSNSRIANICLSITITPRPLRIFMHIGHHCAYCPLHTGAFWLVILWL